MAIIRLLLITSGGFNTAPLQLQLYKQLQRPRWLVTTQDVTRVGLMVTLQVSNQSARIILISFSVNATNATLCQTGRLKIKLLRQIQTNPTVSAWGDVLDSTLLGQLEAGTESSTGAGTITTLGFRRTNVNQPGLMRYCRSMALQLKVLRQHGFVVNDKTTLGFIRRRRCCWCVYRFR